MTKTTIQTIQPLFEEKRKCKKCRAEMVLDETECDNHLFIVCLKCGWDYFILIKPKEQQEAPALCTERYCFFHCPDCPSQNKF